MHTPRRLRAQLALAVSDGAMIGRVLAETAVTVAVTADATAPPHTETPYPRQLESERKGSFCTAGHLAVFAHKIAAPFVSRPR